MLVYPSSIDLSTRTLQFLAGQLTARRRDIGTRWRRLPVLAERKGTVSAVACTVLDGTPTAVTGGAEGIVRIWDLRAGALLQSLVAPTCGDIALTSDGRTVMLLGRDVAILERT